MEAEGGATAGRVVARAEIEEQQHPVPALRRLNAKDECESRRGERNRPRWVGIDRRVRRGQQQTLLEGIERGQAAERTPKNRTVRQKGADIDKPTQKRIQIT
eukprot:scaffold151860_cov27-Tisochrysis_lutea.AAC.4